MNTVCGSLIAGDTASICPPLCAPGARRATTYDFAPRLRCHASCTAPTCPDAVTPSGASTAPEGAPPADFVPPPLVILIAASATAPATSSAPSAMTPRLMIGLRTNCPVIVDALPMPGVAVRASAEIVNGSCAPSPRNDGDRT